MDTQKQGIPKMNAHYIDYIRALKKGVIINDYSYNPKLLRLERMRHIKVAYIMPVTGATYWQYHYEPPVISQAVAAPPLAVESKPTLASIRLADKIRYRDGQKIITAQWSQPVYKVTGEAHGCILLEDYRGGVIGRKPENVKVA